MEDFALVHGLHGLLNANSSLFQRFAQHPKVLHDEKTDLWRYKVRLRALESSSNAQPDYDVNSPASLVALLREKYHHPSALTPVSAAAGMRVAELKESYPPAREVVEELANAQPTENREVLALRGKRDGAIRHVFWNPVRGADVRPIDRGAFSRGVDQQLTEQSFATCGTVCRSPTRSILPAISRARASVPPAPPRRHPRHPHSRRRRSVASVASAVRRRASSSCRIPTSRAWI